jgi:hypothetical protein
LTSDTPRHALSVAKTFGSACTALRISTCLLGEHDGKHCFQARAQLAAGAPLTAITEHQHSIVERRTL